MGALVLRVVTSPEIKTEYLSEKGEWGERKDAEIYPNYDAADQVADNLRRQGEDHVHASVCEPNKPPPSRYCKDNAPPDFVRAPRPRPRSRKERQRTREEEMRADDLRELEEIEVYG